ncbi:MULTISPECIES: HNH endonuclease [Acinetobacter]|uniref:HNH endonuclease n=1 Tax=Acinetobacter TaxID=469 RepID=UPI002026CF11|nr:HNH endonuclease signature motif containing protein [Acinetobacter sp. AS23]URM39799.1 HNH endonuclease [Acinetobacter sp. AS23]
MSSDRYIPVEIKRQVRQKCFFGCVICGMPFYEYEHIEEYAQVKEHTVENIILLCPNHHASKTTQKLSKERLIYAKNNPFNGSKEHTSAYKIEPSSNLEIKIGTNTCIGWNVSRIKDHHIFFINGESYFTLHADDDGWLTVSLKITDPQGEVLLKFTKGELTVNTNIFDFSYEGNRILIRDKDSKKIILDVRIADNIVAISYAYFMHQGNDGFMVENGTLYTIGDQTIIGMDTGSLYSHNYHGAWGLLNIRKYPNIKKPGGFGSFITCS